jgi:hypothetical protein
MPWPLSLPLRKNVKWEIWYNNIHARLTNRGSLGED